VRCVTRQSDLTAARRWGGDVNRPIGQDPAEKVGEGRRPAGHLVVARTEVEVAGAGAVLQRPEKGRELGQRGLTVPLPKVNKKHVQTRVLTRALGVSDGLSHEYSEGVPGTHKDAASGKPE
jgi:hypothetical protein